MTDKFIVECLIKNRHDGFRLLFDRYYRPMCVFGYKYIAQLDVVEDLAQEVLMKIWDNGGFEKMTNLKAYLFTAIRNKCLSYLRETSKGTLVHPDYDWEKHLIILEDDSEILEDKLKEAYAAIENLPPACRDVFKAVVISNLKYSEAAEELKISVNTVKTHMKKAYRLLEHELRAVFIIL